MISDQTITQAQKSTQRFLNNSNKLNENFYTCFCLIRNNQIVREKNDSLYINLASTSKPFLIYFLGLSLEKYKDKKISPKFKITPELVKELINRKKEHFFTSKKKFQRVQNWIESEKTNKDNKKNKIKVNFSTVSLDFSELCEVVLKFSSNQGSIIAKNKLDEIFKNHEALQREFNELKIAQTLELNKGGFEFWNQNGANTGRLRDITISFNNLFGIDIEKSNKNQQSKIQNHVVKSLKWGKCFGLEQDLRRIDNVKMWCKDGIVWPIVWGKTLSQQGFPPHLSIGILMRIENEENSFTLGYFKAVEVMLPKDVDYSKFPDYIDDKKYNSYISFIKQKYNIVLYFEVKKFLIKEGIVKKYRSNLLNLIKMYLKLNYYYIKSHF